MITPLEASLSFAKKHLSDMLSFFGLNSDVEAISEDGEVIELNIPSSELNGFLIGSNGETVRAFQHLLSGALKNGHFEFYRVNIDVADYKKQRAARLADRAQEWIAKVKETGEPLPLEPMNAADRRTIHRTAVDAGLRTESVGEYQDRHVVLKPGA